VFADLHIIKIEPEALEALDQKGDERFALAF